MTRFVGSAGNIVHHLISHQTLLNQATSTAIDCGRTYFTLYPPRDTTTRLVDEEMETITASCIHGSRCYRMENKNGNIYERVILVSPKCVVGVCLSHGVCVNLIYSSDEYPSIGTRRSQFCGNYPLAHLGIQCQRQGARWRHRRLRTKCASAAPCLDRASSIT